MPDRYDRIRSLGRRLRLAVHVTVAALAVVFLWIVWDALAGAGWLSQALTSAYALPAPFAATPPQAALLLVVIAVQFGLFAGALQALGRAFAAIANADSIAPEAGLWMRRAGFAFLGAAVAMILARPLNALIMSIGAPPGERFVSVGFSTGELLAFVVSGVLVLFGHLLALAAEIDAENREIV